MSDFRHNEIGCSGKDQVLHSLFVVVLVGIELELGLAKGADVAVLLPAAQEFRKALNTADTHKLEATVLVHRPRLRKYRADDLQVAGDGFRKRRGHCGDLKARMVSVKNGNGWKGRWIVRRIERLNTSICRKIFGYRVENTHKDHTFR
ncbi:hypothetical protein QR680_012325 [Steinernema hermaphroditum]|uniref:Uncharacterized protein n=1 Tax=Steinernema hermaphroditum TaxID=289476 RepID=A0AA39I1Q0_9BILA|nr:hypothetical protein QR680_012325 [Steinernema hermaphroditum]